MPRIRSIKPELWQSPQVMNLSHGARLLFIGLITQADDEGRGSADLRKLKAAVFPGDDCSVVDVSTWLAELAVQRLAAVYEADGHGSLYELPTWTDHQSIDRAKSSRYPPSTSVRRKVVDTTPNDREGSEGIGEDRKGREGKRARARDDSPGQAPEAAPELPPGLDPAAWKRWHDYRREIRKPLKPVSLPAAQRELAAFGCDQAAVVEQSIAHGWQGLFPLKHRPNGAHRPDKPPPRRLRTADEIEAEEAARAGH